MSGIDPNLISSANSVGAMEATTNTANIFGAPQPFMAKAIQAGGNKLGAEQSAIIAQLTGDMGVEGVANAIGSSYQPGSMGSGLARSMYGNPAISPMQAMMVNQALGGLGQPQQRQAPQIPQAQVRQGQAVNVSDPVAALLAPKRKKERPMISLL
jgi:hypothetical protein